MRTRLRLMCAFASLGLVVVGLAHAGTQTEPSLYLVGAAKRSIAPDADGTFSGEQIYMGGAGSGPAIKGIQAPGVHARAFAVSPADDPNKTLVIATVETVGQFIAYKQGNYGQAAVRREASRRTGIPPERILVTSNHSHSGPDTIGVWSPSPPGSYRRSGADVDPAGTEFLLWD